MEFQIWGKLDEDGRIQTVQSSCSYAAEQGPSGVQQTSEGKGEWSVSHRCVSPGDELLSVDEKKKPVYQLDSKIDEMSCIMVRLGDLTKILNYQENPCTANVSSEVQIRFKMDPTRRAKSLDGYNLIEDDQVVDPPTLPPRPKTVTVLSKGPTDGMPATSNSGTEKKKDDTLNCLMRTMRTTMEWNKARKTLMKKSTSCTVDMVERALGQLVQDMCHKLAPLKDTKYASLSPDIAKLRKLLKNSDDEDIMTEDFLKKCSGLYLNRYEYVHL